MCFSGLSPRPSFLLIAWSLLMASSILIASTPSISGDFQFVSPAQTSLSNTRSNLIQLLDCHTHMDISKATLVQYTQIVLLMLKFFFAQFFTMSANSATKYLIVTFRTRDLSSVSLFLLTLHPNQHYVLIQYQVLSPNHFLSHSFLSIILLLL